jgi:UDPglucose 6-dehydrogenase
MKIAVIGTGYVGLVTGACLASWGHDVHCVDQNQPKIARLNAGEMPIYEPGLAEIIATAAAAGRLRFSSGLVEAVKDAQVTFITVGTPSAEGGDADLNFVYAAARGVAPHLPAGAVLVVKSTVPVGTGDVVERIVHGARTGGRVAVASNPEFLREGSAVSDFLSPDRVIIGTEDSQARSIMLTVYAPVADKAPIVFTSRRTSELTKYVPNSFLATKLTFINDIADLCEQVGADVSDLTLGIGLDSRIGRGFLNPGPGYGGSCFPKDTLALLRSAQDAGVTLRLVEDTITANDARKRRMALKVQEATGGSVYGKTIAILGLAFKPNTDDLRESPALPLVKALQNMGAKVRAYDPEGMEGAASMLEDVAFCPDAYHCASGADATVIVTDWDEFRRLDLGRLRSAMAGNVLVDLRNIISVSASTAHGLRLTNIGGFSPRAGEQGASPADVPPPRGKDQTRFLS